MGMRISEGSLRGGRGRVKDGVGAFLFQLFGCVADRKTGRRAK